MRNVAKVLALLVIASFPAAADVISFSSIQTPSPGSLIKFVGNAGASATFSMSTVVKNINGNKNAGFEIQGGSLAGLFGSIQGTYGYTNGDIVITGGTQDATVTGTGTDQFTIWDPLGVAFTAHVAWVDISTFGTSGGTNSQGLVNLTGFAYAGSNAGLLALLHGSDGILTASFQFIPGKSLTALETGNHNASYSGALAVPDGGMTLMLLGGALLGVESLRRKLRV